ncbi:MAG: pitrilysin family protein [Nitrospirota bacterium]
MKRKFQILFVLIALLFLYTGAEAEEKPKRVVLKNGIVLLLQERHSIPTVVFNIKIKAGSIYEPDELAGLASLTAGLLTEGTKARTAKQISEEIDFVGGSIGTSANLDYAAASLSILKKDITLGLDLLSDILMNPAFDEKEIERERSQTLAGIINQKDDPGAIASNAFSKILYLRHPYSRPSEGLEGTLPKIKKEDIINFHRKYYRPNNTIMSVVGNITQDEAVSLIEKYFGKWEKAKVSLPKIPSPPKLTNKNVELIDKDLTQATIHLGHIGISRKNPDFYTLIVMNYMLGGGGFSSRLVEDIRDNQGLAYSVSSGFDAGLYEGPFKVVMQTKNENANKAINAILKHIEDIRTNPVKDNELNDARSYIVGSFPLRLDTNSKMAGLLSLIEFYDLGLNYFTEYPKKINAVTKEDILKAAKKYLDPKNYLLVVVAKQKEAEIAR